MDGRADTQRERQKLVEEEGKSGEKEERGKDIKRSKRRLELKKIADKIPFASFGFASFPICVRLSLSDYGPLSTFPPIGTVLLSVVAHLFVCLSRPELDVS